MKRKMRWCFLAFLIILGIKGPGLTSESQTTLEPQTKQADEPQRPLDVHYVPTPHEVVSAMLKMANVTKGDVVYDLGCGDGRIVIAAVKEYGADHGVGIDLDPKRLREARENAVRDGVQDKVEFREQDLFSADLKPATVVTLYLLSSLNEKLRPKLMRELKPGTRIVSHQFDMEGWNPDQQAIVAGRNIYMWIVPERP